MAFYRRRHAGDVAGALSSLYRRPADPILDAAVFGIAILAAGFMLSWGAESAEGQISSGLILAIVALITVLPEYAVDIYYAWRAGQSPESNYVHYAAANMTGANRLLVGLAWPLLVLVNWWRNRERAIDLGLVNSVLFGLALLLRLRLGLAAAAALALLFAAQVALAFLFRADELRTIATLTWLGWAYIGPAAAIAEANLGGLRLVWSGLFGNLRTPPAATAAGELGQ